MKVVLIAVLLLCVQTVYAQQAYPIKGRVIRVKSGPTWSLMMERGGSIVTHAIDTVTVCYALPENSRDSLRAECTVQTALSVYKRPTEGVFLDCVVDARGKLLYLLNHAVLLPLKDAQ